MSVITVGNLCEYYTRLVVLYLHEICNDNLHQFTYMFICYSIGSVISPYSVRLVEYVPNMYVSAYIQC